MLDNKCCDNCKHFRKHKVQGQLFRVYCELPEGRDYVELGGYCSEFEYANDDDSYA